MTFEKEGWSVTGPLAWDLQQLYDLIQTLELRIIELEKLTTPALPNAPDGWYFDH